MSKKLKKNKRVKAAVKASPVLSDKQVLDILTSEESGRERPDHCSKCGKRNSSLKKSGKYYLCAKCRVEE